MPQTNLFGDNDGFSPAEIHTFLTQHTHAGSIGDGKKIRAFSIDFSAPITQGQGPIIRGIDVNGNPTGNKWQIVVVEKLDENGRITGVIGLIQV
jgi:hypothetical protein